LREIAKKSPVTPNYERCSKEVARALVDTFPSHAKRSVAYHALNVIIEALGEDNTASLADVLAELFPAVDIEKARRRLTTEIANRVYKDDAGNAPLKIVCTRKGDEPALIWLESIVVTDTRGLMDAGERYAPENFIASDAVQATSEDIKREIANPPPAPSLPAAHSGEEGSSDEAAIEEDERIEARDARRDDSPKSDSYRQAHTRAIENATKPNSGVNDSLRGIDTTNFTATDALRTNGFQAFAEASTDKSNTVNALDAMLTWASDASPNAPKLLALLGDYGTGKTSHALQFSRVLNGEVPHEKRPAQLLSALHIDLAYLRGAPGLAQLNVTQLIGLVIDARGLSDVLSPNTVVREVREGRRIVVYDGLDELMQTDHAQLHSVFRQLLQIFEPDPVTRAPSRARAIVSCRTHYFRDLAEQHEFFNSRMRGGVSSKDYLCLYLLPWKPSTVREYLNKRLSKDEAKALDETIRTTYNLEELASRPVLLAMMCEQLGEVLRLRDANGGSITASTLYAQTVAMWVRRDDEKHILQATHKPILMGALACAMWNDGKESWAAERLDNWLRKTVDQLFPNHYSSEQTRAIQDDLRTATFIVRPSGKGFTFAHRSFNEFFLARHLLTMMDWHSSGSTLTDLHAERMLLPTRKLTYQSMKFLDYMLLEKQEALPARAKKLWTWLSYEPDGNSTDNAPPIHLALFDVACECLLDAPKDAGRANLRGLELGSISWRGMRFPPLDLRNANLTDARIVECSFPSILANGARMDFTIFRDCTIGELNRAEVSGEGLTFRQRAERGSGKEPLEGPWSRPHTSAHPSLASQNSIRMELLHADDKLFVVLIGRMWVNCWDTQSGRLLWINNCQIRSPDFAGRWWIDTKRQCVVHLVTPSGTTEEFALEDGKRRSVLRSIKLSDTDKQAFVERSYGVDGQRIQKHLIQSGPLSGCTRYFVHSAVHSTACFDAEGRLVDYDEEAADTWLRYLGNGYSQPVEAAWLELDEFGRVLGPKKEAAS
jgi:hypothetical protein